MNTIKGYVACLLLALAALPGAVLACTGIDFSVKIDGYGSRTFAGRTMEFGPDVTSWKLLYVPHKAEYASCTLSRLHTCGDDSSGKKIIGYTWQTRYSYTGFTPMRPIKNPLDPGKPFEYTLKEITDGINEAGLYCGGFYHMGTEEYSKEPYVEGQKNISDMDFIAWVLGQFGTVAELQLALSAKEGGKLFQPVYVRQFDVELLDIPVTSMKKFPQLHYKVVDRFGAAVVIEFVDGKPRIFDSVGVITNNPTYDWMVTNLRNYVNLKTENYESVDLLRSTYTKLSNGTGALGLPGDFTSPSRFVRAAYLLDATLTSQRFGNVVQSPEDAILRSFRVLNQFDIPKGAVVEVHSENPPKATLEMTSWTSMADLKSKLYYYHTMNTRVIRMVSLQELMDRIPEGDPVAIELPASELILDVSDQFKAK